MHAGWEKGQVENQVSLVREHFFTPRLRFKNLDEVNAWLLDKYIAYAKAHRHPELTDQTIWQVFEAERPKLVEKIRSSACWSSNPTSRAERTPVERDKQGFRFRPAASMLFANLRLPHSINLMGRRDNEQEDYPLGCTRRG